MSTDWLPPLVLLVESGGDWAIYEEELYKWFTADFIDTLPSWPGKRVGLKRHPVTKEKVTTFWHFISSGASEHNRNIDTSRCESIRWPRPMMDSFNERCPIPQDRIVWWKNERSGESRYILALPDFSYLVVVADSGEYVLPWTQYHVEYEHRRNKLRREYNSYWSDKS